MIDRKERKKGPECATWTCVLCFGVCTARASGKGLKRVSSATVMMFKLILIESLFFDSVD